MIKTTEETDMHPASFRDCRESISGCLGHFGASEKTQREQQVLRIEVGGAEKVKIQAMPVPQPQCQGRPRLTEQNAQARHQAEATSLFALAATP